MTLLLFSIFTCTRICSGSDSRRVGCVNYEGNYNSLMPFTGDATRDVVSGLQSIWVARYLISETGEHSLRFTVNSYAEQYPELNLSLTIGDKTYTNSNFTIDEIASGTYFHNATYTNYLFSGTYVYLRFAHAKCTKCNAYITVKSGNSDFRYLKGSECWPYDVCDERCTDADMNPGQVCMPYTYSMVDSRLLNSVARKSVVVGSLLTLLL